MKNVPNFVKNVSRVPKWILRWGSTPNHFLIGSKMKLWTMSYKMGVSTTTGSDVPNFVKDVPNFPKHVSRWGSATNHFLMGFQMKLWTLDDKMGVPKAIGWDIPNFTKDVPNFFKDVPDFMKDVPRVPRYFLRWGLTPNHFLMGFKMKLWTISDKMGVPTIIRSNVP